ncbi:hypothetical protein SRABI05_00085 [Agrobacterium fabrum]|uniref:hypothetical protein n=1 Tax=Agrobacterium fabrum TaxID=1176649 RepID=UPI001D9F204B|nr:hypothetical protein [Agrobacterium fabrum]CAH0132650.1 hypothetical protein SRABI05_00085 [Agrobacterium fabrum]CAH0152101.1 hypothetical protein SRABI46_00800 [Agrobacterium fabrum]
MRKWVLSAVFFASITAPAMAGFQQWSVDTEDDPFSGGKRVTVDFMSSIRSGVIVICDTAEKGLMFRAIPGFVFDSRLQGLTPEIEFAIDGVRLLGQTGETGAVGDNLAAAQVMLTKENAESLVAAFATAKKQIAIKDGISDRPHLLTARGSTKAGASLLTCMKLQK